MNPPISSYLQCRAFRNQWCRLLASKYFRDRARYPKRLAICLHSKLVPREIAYRQTRCDRIEPSSGECCRPSRRKECMKDKSSGESMHFTMYQDSLPGDASFPNTTTPLSSISHHTVHTCICISTYFDF
jgi:hypothetical protein